MNIRNPLKQFFFNGLEGLRKWSLPHILQMFEEMQLHCPSCVLRCYSLELLVGTGLLQQWHLVDLHRMSRQLPRGSQSFWCPLVSSECSMLEVCMLDMSPSPLRGPRLLQWHFRCRAGRFRAVRQRTKVGARRREFSFVLLRFERFQRVAAWSILGGRPHLHSPIAESLHLQNSKGAPLLLWSQWGVSR